MKKFLVKIWAYDHYGAFEIKAEDNAESIENSILDKIGEKSIKWESTGMFSNTPNRIKLEKSLLTLNSKRPKLQIEKMQLKMLLPKFLWQLK
jgi:hypothetical protein